MERSELSRAASPPAPTRGDSVTGGVWRAIDANLNRAAEGFRVIEDYLRFVVDQGPLAGECKQLRHRLFAHLAAFPAAERLAARDAEADVGRYHKAPQELVRSDAQAVVLTNFSRVQQALRSLEEWSKLVHPEIAIQIEQLRYDCYTLQTRVAAVDRTSDDLRAARLYVLIDGGLSRQDFIQRVQSLMDTEVATVVRGQKRQAGDHDG